MSATPAYWQWFNQARFGMFIHWGAYSVYGRGEQVLFREHLDQRAYAEQACRWQPQRYDPAAWAATARRAGMRYAVLTTRHHDGFCLWDSKLTDYSTARQAAGRDMVRDYVDAFRAAGLRVGLYYSLCDWRIPAYWEGPKHDPAGWRAFRDYVHGQVRELLTNYGKIDVFWFDGAWPHTQEDWGGAELVDMMRTLQPHILINDRLGASVHDSTVENPGKSRTLGDFGTPEHEIRAENRFWESCQVSTWRLWGYTIGERWRPADVLLDFLVTAAGKGGNLLLNVGPTPDGELPPQFIKQMAAIGEWMDVHGEAVYGSEAGDVCEFITYGWQTRKGNNLYLIVRFWDGRDTMTLSGLETRVTEATLLTTGQELAFEQTLDHLYIKGLPATPPTDLFPVIKLDCAGPPTPRPWAAQRLWQGDARRMTAWARVRGDSVSASGH